MNTRLLCWALLLSAWFVNAAEPPKPLALGSPAPDFSLPGVDGKTHKLADFKAAKLLAIVFTCNHCPTAQYYEDRLKKLVDDYKAKGVALIAISPNDPKSVRLDELGYADLGDSFGEMKIRAKHKEYNFPYLYDGDSEESSKKYGPVATPHIFLFDSERKLRYAGAIDDSERPQHVKKHYLRDAIDSLLAGKAPELAQTKVIGCSVKWAGKADAVQAYLDKLAAEPVKLDSIDAAGIKELRANKSGKIRMVNFWATWCAPCIVEFPEIVAMNRMYRQRDFEMVTVSMNRPDEQKSVLEFLKKQQASHKNYIFGTEDRDPLINAFDPEWEGQAPYTLLLDTDGKVLYKESGSIDTLAMKRAIVKALNDKKPW